MADTDQLYIKKDDLKAEFVRILKKYGFNDQKADACAGIFTLNSLEGVYSHGVNRFAVFIKTVRDGYVKPDAEPSLKVSAGALEQWNGNLGPGPLNAIFSTERAMALASENGIGMVALANTNHWMRAGTYGWQAARKGFAFIAWTNTIALMPAWGAVDPKIGNNPLVFAIPYGNEAIVLDFAMSQFSFGKMETYYLEKKQMPYPAGFDNEGKLTTDPYTVLKNRRALPIGYWKGTGLALLLDIFATVLSGGQATCQLNPDEYAISQIFVAIDLSKLSNSSGIRNALDTIISDLKKSVPESENTGVRYPGESVVKIREENLRRGIPVNRIKWERIKAL
jgi:3-dehydro-L-gulonate 2-dehydrogenase